MSELRQTEEASAVPAADLREALQDLLNSHNAENGSDTPDFILADFLSQCLAAFDLAVSARQRWYHQDSLNRNGPGW